jgi:PhoPQ-activated pathogenicity-related protein
MKQNNSIFSGTFVAMLSLSILLGSSASAQETATKDVKPGATIVPVSTKLNETTTALDAYVAMPDDTYDWKVVSTHHESGATTFVVDLTSQRWLRDDEVDRNIWQHWLTIVKPDKATADTALLFIGGGKNGRAAPKGADERTTKIAMATNTVVAQLGTIPNQPLIFHGDGRPRSEDDLIGYTWDYYLKTGDARWPARLPMVKSVVRAMDTVQALMGSAEGGDLKINEFVIAGGSKRGWTTWMTAAVDSRVAAIAPIVIDVLNVNVSMRHHYSAYGFWAPAIGDYVAHKLTHRRHWPRYAELLQLVDPFAYRDRFTMPKCIINATGDQFFLPDSSQFYFDELPAEKHLCYVPNGDHGLDGTNALDTLVAFHFAIVNDIERPQFSWTFPDTSTIRIECAAKPKRVLLWQAKNEQARDFRVETIGRAYRSSELSTNGDGSYLAKVDVPTKGWVACFCQLEFDIGAPTPLRLTTPVRVAPEELPFADKEAPRIDEEE